ncbi:hypothetical protein [Streptomyces sp. RK9]
MPRLGHPLPALTRWVVPPSAPGDLCDPGHLAALKAAQGAAARAHRK